MASVYTSVNSLLTIDARLTSQALEKVTKGIPHALRYAINDLARQTQIAENANMVKTFAHPRPFTAKSVVVDYATIGNLNAAVGVRPEVAHYLQPYETGGQHVLPGAALLAPAGIKLDQYGQLPYQTMQRLKARPDIFIGRIQTKGGLVSGVWQRLAITRKGNKRRTKGKRIPGVRIYHPVHGALKLLIRFEDNRAVNKDLNFVEDGIALIVANAPAAVRAAIVKAMS